MSAVLYLKVERKAQRESSADQLVHGGGGEKRNKNSES
jgi:hypothetical protein